jgi:hypothetical protein
MSKVELRKNYCLNDGKKFYNSSGKRRACGITKYKGCPVRDFKSDTCSKKCSIEWNRKRLDYKRIVKKYIRKYLK